MIIELIFAYEFTSMQYFDSCPVRRQGPELGTLRKGGIQVLMTGRLTDRQDGISENFRIFKFCQIWKILAKSQISAVICNTKITDSTAISEIVKNWQSYQNLKHTCKYAKSQFLSFPVASLLQAVPALVKFSKIAKSWISVIATGTTIKQARNPCTLAALESFCTVFENFEIFSNLKL